MRIGGITLVALVITIIVLLILASIALSALKGDDGIISEAVNAKDETRAARVQERVELWKSKQEINKYKKNKTEKSLDEFLSELESEELIKPEESTAIKSTGEITIGSKNIVFKAKEITASYIANAADKRVYYGAEVTGYTCASAGVSKWRIFYADSNNIYLIADDYINFKDAPNSKSGNAIDGMGDYVANFIGVYNDYSGSEWILGKTDGKENSLAKDFLSKYLNYTTDGGSTYPNRTCTDEHINSIAYMLDTKVWSEKYAGQRAKYAIGGPTIEMFVESYNQTHPDSNVYCDVTTEVSHGEGYSFGGDLSNDCNEIYTKMATQKANGMWIASPSHEYQCIVATFTNDTNNTSSLVGQHYGNDVGLRPVVCLNPDVQLEKVSDGKYSIIE